MAPVLAPVLALVQVQVQDFQMPAHSRIHHLLDLKLSIGRFGHPRIRLRRHYRPHRRNQQRIKQRIKQNISHLPRVFPKK